MRRELDDGLLVLLRVHLHVEVFEVAQHHRLDGRGRGDHDAAVLHGVAQRAEHGRVNHRAALELEGVDAFSHDGGEGLAHALPTHLEQRPGHHRQHQRLAVRQHEGQHRGDHRGFALAHDHLLDFGAVAPEGLDEVIHDHDLLFAQHNVPAELEHQVPGVVEPLARASDLLADVVSLGQ